MQPFSRIPVAFFMLLGLSYGCSGPKKDFCDLPPYVEPSASTFFAPTVYEVKEGDTVMKIAIKTGVSSVDSLRDANRLTNDEIAVGQRLIIPGFSANRTNVISAGNDEQREVR